VLDPSQQLRRRCDIGIKHGQIVALVNGGIPADRATQRYDVGGRLTTPGLIDLHTHYGPLISGIGLPADELVPITATTTGVSAGDAGANTYAALKHWVTGQSRTRLYAFVHISAIGLAGGVAVPETLKESLNNSSVVAQAVL
jgi:dihydroorotase